MNFDMDYTEWQENYYDGVDLPEIENWYGGSVLILQRVGR